MRAPLSHAGALPDARTLDDGQAANDLDIPTFRGTVLEVIRMAGDPECQHHRLVEVVSRDPALSIKTLRYANSAAFQLATEVTTVSRAVSIIGTKALRNLAICFAACDVAPQKAIGDFDLEAFLEDGLRRGAAAEVLAKALGWSDPDEAFTAGLLQDFGVVAMMMRSPSRAAEWNATRCEKAEHRRELEHATFGMRHDEVGAVVARAWQLPTGLADVMEYHHRLEADGAADKPLVQLASWAEALADIYIVRDKQSAIDNAFARLKNECQLDDAAIEDVISAIPPKVDEYASVLGLRVDRQQEFKDVLREMREQTRLLVEMNLGFQEKTWKLEKILREKERVETELRLATARLERLAATDPLTGVPNRRNFEENLERELNRTQRSRTPLSVLIVDVDLFKRVNDTYGHPFGDVVLKMVATTLKDRVRATDLVARLGGEEFGVLLPATDKVTGWRVGERLRKAIEAQALTCGTRTVRVTVSIGGATVDQVLPGDSLPQTGWTAVSAADKCLYSAKKAGRNRLVWTSKPVRLNGRG